MKDLSIGVRLAWKIAAGEAGAGRHECVEKEHMLIGICSLEKVLMASPKGGQVDPRVRQSVQSEHEVVIKALSEFALNPAKLRHDLRIGLGQGSRAPEKHEIHRSDACKRAFIRANQLATKEITCVELFAAMLDEPGKVLGGVLSDAGVKPADLRMRLLPSEFVPSGLPGFAWASDKELSSIQQFTSKNRLQTLTIMFDDIVGSTVLGSRLGATEFHRVCKRHDETVAKIVMRERVGKVIKSTGDGLLMVFCGPSAAVERALEIQAAFHKDAHLKLRIGIDMGQIMQTADGPLRDIFGPRVATARRITDVAKEGGHVLTSKAVYDDASQWLPKEKVLWQGLGSVSCKPGEPPLDIYEAYNPAITKPMASLEGR